MRYVALLRGINVSGQKLIKMAELKQHFEMPGLANITTYIQSGNVLFDTSEHQAGVIRQQIEAQLQLKLGYAVPVIVRSLPELHQVVESCPFSLPYHSEEMRLYVSFLSVAPGRAQCSELEGYSYETEQIKVLGSEAYLLTATYGSTRFPNTFVEKKLGVQSTVRNWNTVNKLLSL